ncbi:hypothetical protein [Aquabacterium sp.]|uniref:hypothetical protein n=1 Tax=Aquabacterium sp. TaxID=1872578 RepID=UPI003D6D54E9
MTLQYRMAVAIGLSAFFCAPTWAGTNFTNLTTYQEGGATVNASTNGAAITQAMNNGDNLQGLRFDFTAGGSAALSLPLSQPKTGAYLALSVRAPLDNKLSVQIIGTNGQTDQVVPCNTGNALCMIDRSASSLDDQGWSRHSLAFTLPTNVTVKTIKLIADGAAHNKGVAYVRSVQILPYAPSSAYPEAPSPSLTLSSVAAEASAGAVVSLWPSGPAYSGDAIQVLEFSFTGPGQMIALNMTPTLPSARSETSYVRFKMNAPVANNAYLRVVDKDGEVFPFLVNRKQTPADIQGWTTHLVKLYSHSGAWGGVPGVTDNKIIDLPLKEIRLVVNSTASASSGRAYFKDIDLLDHAPSPLESLGNLPYLATNSATAVSVSNWAAATVATNTAVAAGQDGVRSFKFTPSAGKTIAGMSIGLPSGRPTNGQTLHFLAKLPLGYNLNLQFNDEAEQAFDARAIRPLAVVDDAGWVEHTVKLERTGTPSIYNAIKRFIFVVSANGMGGIVAASPTPGSSEVEVQIKSLYVDEHVYAPQDASTPERVKADHALDLVAGTPVSADWRAVYADPLLNTGVASPASDAALARDIGFRKVRFEFYWASIEKTAGVYNFTNYITPMQSLMALPSPTVDPIVILDYNNTLYSGATDKSAIHAGTTNQTAFLNFVTRAATEVKNNFPNQLGRVTFEIWNEQNVAAKNWVPLPSDPPGGINAESDYADLLSKASVAIKQVSPLFKVVSGGLALTTDSSQFDTEYLKKVAAAGGYAATPVTSKADAVGHHPYQHDLPELKTVELAGVAAYMRKTLNFQTPFWVTEVGTAASNFTEGLATNVPNDANRKKQARIQLRHVLNSWATNRPLHVLYSLRDRGDNSLSSESYYGLLDSLGQYRPAGNAIKQLFSVANGRKLEGMATGLPSRVQAMKFSANDKDPVYVVWSDNSSTDEVDAITTLSTTSSPPKAWVTDMEGNAVACQPVGGDGRDRCPLSEVGGPIFVRVARP